ncbi:HAMP domain-containing sensor histidine kinase [Methylocaldum sp.]|uniref:sensor histidine kinase n=1 Tax=Methylocaldum sp. TaxID=1969727 RepID=UPI002D4912DE|nr:HAMP domain-containing sensor histidine kinase [Methylocaldum sp.]HYE37327.1 HAMP domain-containing sensor histidine kinase [Methylocaldum sp.]
MLIFFNLLRAISLRKLILVGFTVAILPLVLALVFAVTAVKELAVSSQKTAYRVAQISQKKEMLREKLTDFERKAKRLMVLEDSASRLAFEAVHRDFGEVISNLLSLTDDSALVAQLQQFSVDEGAIYQHVSTISNESAARSEKTNSRRSGATRELRDGIRKVRLEKADEMFSALNLKARNLARGFSEIVDFEVDNLESRSDAVQRRMLQESSVLLPVSVVLISFVTFFIIRSVRQMDRAIRKLGAGDLIRPIEVTGPKDLEYLGERLDWLRSRLRALEEGKQQFIRHVSHEIKTPLATIHEGTELLADEVVGELNTEQSEIAQIVVSNTQKLDTLIAELINYSQVNTRPGALLRETVNMGKLVSELIEDYQIRLRTKSIELTDQLRSVEIDGNPDQLRTVVDNLLSNAVKYSPIGGEIRVTLRHNGGHMELEVEDDGPGIEPDERKHVFEPFFQGKAARKDGVAGTGMGLAIVGECVSGHHGKVEALEPRSDKKGARIRVQIPLRLD